MQSMIGSLIYIIVIGGLFYFLMIKPQKKMQQTRNQMLDNISVGDKIATISGLMGTVTAVNRETLMVEIAAGVVVEMKKTGVAAVENEQANTVEDDDDDDDLYDDLYDDDDE